MNLDCFLEIEEKYKLYDEEIDGFHYWIYVRSVLEEIIVEKVYHMGGPHTAPAKSTLRTIVRVARKIVNSLLYSKYSQYECDILILNHERRIYEDTKYKCAYTEWLSDRFPNSVVIERPYMGKHFRPITTKNIVYTDFIEVAAAIHYAKVRILYRKLYNMLYREISDRLEKPLAEIENAYKIELYRDQIAGLVIRQFYTYRIKKRKYEKIIQSLRPHLVIEVVGANMDCMIVNEISAQNGIPTVELQHGAIGQDKYSYRTNQIIQQFPQYLFVFGDVWKGFAQYPIPADHVIAVGYPRLEKNKQKYVQKSSRNYPKEILFISQGPIGEQLSNLAVELDAIIDHSEYRIVYKLHPGEYNGWKERYKKLADSDVTVIDSHEINLYQLFAQASFQVGSLGSTATLEGLIFGIPVFVMSKNMDEILKILCEKRIAQSFSTATELYQLIQESKEMNIQYDFLWKSDAENNILKEINRLLSK